MKTLYPNAWMLPVRKQAKKILHTRPFLSEKQKKNTGQITLKI